MIDVRMFTVGPVQENCFIVREKDAPNALIVDPGDEADRLLAALDSLKIETVEAILVTHTHFDHIGAVAPVARATGAPVYCPELETEILANINDYLWPGFGPFESYEADHTVGGGETLELAGLTIDVVFTPGHSPGHVTYAIAPAALDRAVGADSSAGADVDADTRSAQALLSGDVLFQGSVGRVDLPGGNWSVLERSIGTLMGRFPAETLVYPGHMGVTTLGRELQTNPFLAELRSAVGAAAS
jgi:glyoxylase-like metal-dependent hydrolase (beta-lactamase superfamily II)